MYIFFFHLINFLSVKIFLVNFFLSHQFVSWKFFYPPNFHLKFFLTHKKCLNLLFSKNDKKNSKKEKNAVGKSTVREPPVQLTVNYQYPSSPCCLMTMTNWCTVSESRRKTRALRSFQISQVVRAKRVSNPLSPIQLWRRSRHQCCKETQAVDAGRGAWSASRRIYQTCRVKEQKMNKCSWSHRAQFVLASRPCRRRRSAVERGPSIPNETVAI